MVEEEDETSYKTTQYLIKKKWTLVISKTSDPDLQSTHTFRVQRKMSNGELRDLVGKPKVYVDRNCKYPRLLDSEVQ